ncbi:MAG: class III signal peptide-containing protein [Halobacteriovoraceae bacterium]|nr:class III signal peptide-containing protein [Halobacteriovoraceae bacterium]
MSNKKGQTSVEYIFIIAIVSAIIFSVAKNLRSAFIEQKGQCTEKSTSLTCMVDRLFYGRDNFRYYVIPFR